MEPHPWKKSSAAWTISFAKPRFSTSASRTLPHGGSPRQTLWPSFEAGHSLPVSDRIQPDRANGGARTDSHGESFELGGSGLVSVGAWSSKREISRRRQGRRRVDEQ